MKQLAKWNYYSSYYVQLQDMDLYIQRTLKRFPKNIIINVRVIDLRQK